MVSGKWLLGAFAVAVGAAGFCAWAVLCLLFWQGSWQLLYHPSSKVARTPAAAGLAFDKINFAVDAAGTPQLEGWWIPAPKPEAQYTVLYLHGQDGNLGDTLDELGRLHNAGVNVFAIDYRGYGDSVFAHPSEAHWQQDAVWARSYLIDTRHIAPRNIILAGKRLGANLAFALATAQPQAGGVVLIDPVAAPMNAVFDDPRAHLVPAHLLVRDRYDLMAFAAFVEIPSLWVVSESQRGQAELNDDYQAVKARKMRVSAGTSDTVGDDLKRWLADLK